MGRRGRRRDLREHEPGQRRDARRLSEVDRRRRRSRGRRSQGGLRGLAPRAGAEARRDHLPLRAAPDRAERGHRAADGPRDGQGAARGARRRAGGHRHGLLHGRRGTAPLRPDDAVGAPGQVQHERAHADRSRRGDHAVELPDRHPLLEDPARARLREHGRLQAGDGHAVPGRALRGAARGSGRSRRCRQRRAWGRRRGRQRDRRASRRAGDHA